jgi:deoxyhypusine synthase
MKIRDFLGHHYRHFNAATVVEAAEAYRREIDSGRKMMITIAGAMSTAELGVSLAEMIRQEKVHAVCCTGANLEEDLFNLVAHDHYHRVPDWRNLTPEEEKVLESRGLNRVTDTCIPEEEAFKTIEDPILELWQKAGRAGERHFPHEYLYELLNEETLRDRYQVDPADSWMVAAAERNLPLFVPGWEDSSLANVFVARVLDGGVSSFEIVKSGLEYMAELVDWYARQTMGRGIAELEQHPEGPPGVRTVHERALPPEEAEGGVGFFQIGGGIAGDFPICAVPLIHQDLRKACPYWSYFCQISDSTTSYGSYSGAFPTEKITWGKLDVDTPKFLIESDATIVAPLIFAYVLGW